MTGNTPEPEGQPLTKEMVIGKYPTLQAILGPEDELALNPAIINSVTEMWGKGKPLYGDNWQLPHLLSQARIGASLFGQLTFHRASDLVVAITALAYEMKPFSKKEADLVWEDLGITVKRRYLPSARKEEDQTLYRFMNGIFSGAVDLRRQIEMGNRKQPLKNNPDTEIPDVFKKGLEGFDLDPSK